MLSIIFEHLATNPQPPKKTQNKKPKKNPLLQKKKKKQKKTTKALSFFHLWYVTAVYRRCGVLAWVCLGCNPRAAVQSTSICWLLPDLSASTRWPGCRQQGLPQHHTASTAVNLVSQGLAFLPSLFRYSVQHIVSVRISTHRKGHLNFPDRQGDAQRACWA